jgi:CheY-like chemotaxis protein
MLKMTLERAGFRVDTFNDPVLALKSYKPHLYDLVILDVIMPKVNGLELYTQLKRKDSGINICFLTASSECYTEMVEVNLHGNGGGGGGSSNDGGGSTSTNECQGQADCFRGTVTEIVDGDTLDINNVRVRLALVNTPERGQSGYTEAIDFVQSVCGVGTTALVDEDDGQKEGSFDRLIGLVHCGNDNINNKKSLNELLLEGGYAVIYQDFCGISEFSSASWVQSRGC